MQNVLFITLDQLRGDCLSVAGHPIVRTPALDELAAHGVRFTRHFSQAAPCSPGRACLYTGTYQMNNRVVGNGTPLDNRFDNLARVARRAGYRPVLFGYVDQSIDPRQADGPGDPRLSNYQGLLPGLDAELELGDEQEAWRDWLAELGYGQFQDGDAALATEPERPVEHGVSAFLTDRLLEWLGRQEGPFFAHASYWRPHPPYAAAGEWSTAYDPDEVGDPIPRPDWPVPFCGNLAAPAAIDRPSRHARDPGPVLRDGFRSRRPARSGLGRLARPRDVGRDTRGGHGRPRRAARGPWSARQRWHVPSELPHPLHRSRPPATGRPRIA